MRVLHAALLAGVAAVGVAMFLMVRLRGASFLSPEQPTTRFLGYGFLAVCLAMLGMTLVLRGRIPRPARGQTPDQFWESASARTATLVLWMVCEAAAVIAFVGYLLTGAVQALAGGLFAFAVLAAYRPGTLADE